MADDDQVIRVRGARVHNLRNVDVDVPRDRLVVLTGVSGSGKSSLAFDTLYAEGQRRYIEGLSSYARQFLDQLDRPDVDAIDGLPPTVAIDQKAGAAGPRSTVATLTEAHDYLRLLYARAGLPRCAQCGRPIRRQSPEQVVDGVLGLPEGRKVLVMAPIVRGRKGEHKDAFAAIRRAGLIRARVDGQVVELGDPPPKLAKTKAHSIEAVVDRLVVRPGIRPRLAESVDLALKLGEGAIVLTIQGDDGQWEDRSLSTKFACPECGTGLAELEPRTFSFNSPHGACPNCHGLGAVRRFDSERIAPDRSIGLAAGAILPWQRDQADPPAAAVLSAFLKKHGLTRKTPLADWPPAALATLFDGAPDFPGIIPALADALDRARTESKKASLDAYRDDETCSACEGTRLRPEARAVELGGRSLPWLLANPAAEAAAWLRALTFEPPLDQVGPTLVHAVAGRLDFLDEVGLGYLALDRPADSLSGGELQRARLAAQLGSGLVGVCYVLDEPTAGLHPADADRLVRSLVGLRDAGNTVVVVEHDEATIAAADWLIDLGPGAGPEGGLIVATGPPPRPGQPDSLGDSPTVRYLRGDAFVDVPPVDRAARAPGWIEVIGAVEHNLKGDPARFPLAALTCVTGVSGSGKSTLVLDVLARAARRKLDGGGPRPGRFERIDGLESIERLVAVDQSPIGRTSRSTPATYAGFYDEIRRLFARTKEAKARGFGPGRFSFNLKGGRCETCAGHGSRRIAMQFLPDLEVRCETCGGSRFNRPTLEVKFRGRSIAEILGLRVDQAMDVFESVPAIVRGVAALHEAGLGYVTLGQPAPTLSGGEAQRVKLAAAIGRPSADRALYVLDEPTTGLHFADVANLLSLLHRLADLGHAVVVIEHHPDLIKTADWLIDLGPGGGPAGGQIVAQGTPGEVVEVAASVTGRYLASRWGAYRARFSRPGA